MSLPIFLPMITVKSVVTELISYPDLLNPQREHLVKSIFACIICVGNLTHGTTVHVQDLKRKKWRKNVKRCSTIRTKKKRTSFSKWRDPQGRNTISSFIATDFCKNLFESVLNVAQNIYHVCQFFSSLIWIGYANMSDCCDISWLKGCEIWAGQILFKNLSIGNSITERKILQTITFKLSFKVLTSASLNR